MSQLNWQLSESGTTAKLRLAESEKSPYVSVTTSYPVAAYLSHVLFCIFDFYLRQRDYVVYCMILGLLYDFSVMCILFMYCCKHVRLTGV